MQLKKIAVKNFRGVSGQVDIDLRPFNCIVGQNDAGKSTILKALDVFLNETRITFPDYNVSATDDQISIELFFDCQNKQYTLGEEIPTTIEEEELINADGLLQIKKTWTVANYSVGNPKISILRKKYDGGSDFLFKTEAQLMTQCRAAGISTSKGNGEEYNNVEKRNSLRTHLSQVGATFTYDYEDIPSSGTSKAKSIGDAIKKILPLFQYFKADTSLSDTDNTIQKYFKDMASRLIEEEIPTSEMEDRIKEKLDTVLHKVTDKINQVVKYDEKVQPQITFDWTKLITTSFVSSSSGAASIPLSSRGDGFRRITMMSYFEYLAEDGKSSVSEPIIFGFEEPETFLHPSAQENLFDKLYSLASDEYQVIVSTHSPTIVGNTKKEDIIHISKVDGLYTVEQGIIDYKKIAIDLGIKPDNTFAPLFSTSRLIFLVEGIDDANAMHHIAKLYKDNGVISQTFDELNVSIIPIGGCDSVKHWVSLDLFTRLEKPFFIFLDSDKDNISAISPNYTKLVNYGLAPGIDFEISKKRLLENYIHQTALERLVPGHGLTYSDFDHVKNMCKDHADDRIKAFLGGKKVADKHFCSLTYDELRLTWHDGTEDEFQKIYNIILSKLS